MTTRSEKLAWTAMDERLPVEARDAAAQEMDQLNFDVARIERMSRLTCWLFVLGIVAPLALTWALFGLDAVFSVKPLLVALAAIWVAFLGYLNIRYVNLSAGVVTLLAAAALGFWLLLSVVQAMSL